MWLINASLCRCPLQVLEKPPSFLTCHVSTLYAAAFCFCLPWLCFKQFICFAACGLVLGGGVSRAHGLVELAYASTRHE
jgi:hypothetical protein